MLVIGKEILKFKANNKDVNFSTHFYTGKVCIGKIAAAESTEVSFKVCMIFQSITMLSINLT